MCGIIGVFHYGKQAENANEKVVEILQDQINRGKEGFGSSFIADDKIVTTKRATTETKALLDLYMNEAKMIVTHHRMPTSSQNKISQTHPILVDNGSLKHKYLVIHNGVIRNAKELRKKHEDELGFEYTTPRMRTYYNSTEEEFNDSECLAIDLARYIEKQTDVLEAEGSAAFIAIQMDKSDKAKRIFFGRNDGNPLKLTEEKGLIQLSSEGKGENIEQKVMHRFDLQTFKIKKRPFAYFEKPKETKKEYLPSVGKTDRDRGFIIDGFGDVRLLPGQGEHYNQDNDFINEDDGYGYNQDANARFDAILENGIEADIIAESFADNEETAKDVLEEYFDVLSDEETIFASDVDKLATDTIKKLVIQIREAKDKAIDAFSDVYYKQYKEDKSEEDKLKEDKTPAQQLDFVDKLSAK